MSLEAGTRVGRYEIRAPLGRGGMGEVYLAHDPDLDRPVALKFLPQEVASDAERMRRFVQEAKAASALNHPSILTIHEIGQADSGRFIATEFVEGVTLRERLSQGPLPLHEVLDFALQTATALGAAHAAGIVHRDVKPENLMIRRDGLVKVLDFGLAKLAPATTAAAADASTQTQLMTEAGVVMGTARYMSPEQACGLPVDARTDVWSLGVVLYEMVAGRSPWRGATTGEVLAELLEGGAAPPLDRFAPQAPAALGKIVAGALAKSREDRYPSMKDLVLDLKALQDGRPAPGAPTSAGAAFAPARRPAWRARPAAALAVALVLAIALVAALYLRPGAGAAAQVRSLAVLPLTSPAGDTDAELLSDGITESLINSLSQVPDLKVIARSSAFRYKGREADPREAGRDLGVEAVVTGRLARRADRLIVGVEMMQVGDQRQLWGEQYDRPLADLLAVQREMSREISEQLRRRLTPEARARVARSHTENVEAYQLYLKGRHYWFKYPRPEYDKSREYLQQAIDLDPNYALAWAGLADYYGFAAAHGRFRPEEAWPKAEAATRKALALDATLAEAYLGSAGQKMVLYRDWEGAEKEIRRAIELNPGFAELNRLHGTLLTMMGRFEESHVVHRRLLEQEPLAAAYRLSLAHLFYMERRYEEAIAECRKAIELDPNDPWVYQLMGNALEYAGRPAEAVAAWAQNLQLSGESGFAAALERSFADSGFDATVRALSQAELEFHEARAARGEYVPAMFFARLHTRLGNREAAFAWLAKAEEEPNRWILETAVNPTFDPLRGDPRFTALLERLGLAGRPRPA